MNFYIDFDNTLYNTPLLTQEKILNGKDLIFDDSIPFLKKVKQKGHKLYLLTYCKHGIEYQTLKIAGSKLADYFDALIITATPKYTLDLDYANSIFIDDNPDDLLGLYSKNPKQVIRLRRKENKYSVIDINNADIKEYSNFNGIDII